MEIGPIGARFKEGLPECFVLVRAAVIEHHRPSGLNNGLFLTVLEAAKSKIKVLAHVALLRDLL